MRCPASRRLVALAIAAAGAACLSLEGYECDGDAQCNLEGRDGQCLSGYCAYADEDCPTGLRWEDDAPTLGGRCVPPDAATSSGSDSGSGSGSGSGAG